MRRNFGKSSKYVDSKVITFSILGVLLLSTVVFGILMYGKNVNDNVRSSQLSAEQIASLTEKEQEAESASSKIGKSIEESEKEIEENTEILKEEKKNLTAETSVYDKTEEEKQVKETKNTSNKNVETAAKSTPKEVKKELSFHKPVEGEIMRQFAKDNLVYSETLSEWVTHLGIDIKADKTTVINSAEEGTIKSIKNDPRYGLTIVVSHRDGFETVYSNLLSTEFVKEGDKVKKGQAIGTVGNTAVFESMDEPHLHFEILKDSIQVDPNSYIK